MCPTGAKIKEMKNYLKSVTLVLATVTFMTMCLPILLFADSAPLPRVILDAEGFSDWIPTKKIIDAAEQKLSKRFRIEAENAQNLSSTPPSLENYGRQYIGRIVGGRNLVEVGTPWLFWPNSQVFDHQRYIRKVVTYRKQYPLVTPDPKIRAQAERIINDFTP